MHIAGIVYIIFIFFTFFKPKYSIAAFICILPLLGQHPLFPNNRYYFAALLGIITALLFCRSKGRIQSQYFFYLSFIFIVVCFLSLLPYSIQLVQTLNYYYEPASWIGQIIDAPAENSFISIRNFFYLLFLVILSYLLIKKGLIEELSNSLPLYLCSSATFYSIIGILGFFNVLNLEKIRPSTFPAEHRLQSIFWHPAWFAEYTSLILPFFLVLLRRKQSRTSLMIYLSLFWINIASIILTFQRGGLVALFSFGIIWSFFEFKSKRKLLLSLIAVFFIFIIVSFAIVYSLEPHEFQVRFVNKLFENNRTWYWSAAWEMFLKSPLAGLGLDSFGWRYTDFRPVNGHGYVYMHGTAHNQYFQFLAGIGSIGLIIYLALYCYTLVNAYRLFNQTSSSSDLSKFLAFALFGIYSFYQEMFYTLCTGTLFWLVATSIHHKYQFVLLQKQMTRFIKLSLFTTLIVLIAFQSILAIMEYDIFAYTISYEGFGYYPEEPFDQNHHFAHWTARKTFYPIESNVTTLDLLAMHPDINKKPVIAKIYYRNTLLLKVIWNNTEWKTVHIDRDVRHFICPEMLYIAINRVWIPKDYGRLDNRSRGIAIAQEKRH